MALGFVICHQGIDRSVFTLALYLSSILSVALTPGGQLIYRQHSAPGRYCSSRPPSSSSSSFSTGTNKQRHANERGWRWWLGVARTDWHRGQDGDWTEKWTGIASTSFLVLIQGLTYIRVSIVFNRLNSSNVVLVRSLFRIVFSTVKVHRRSNM